MKTMYEVTFIDKTATIATITDDGLTLKHVHYVAALKWMNQQGMKWKWVEMGDGIEQAIAEKG